MLGQVPAFHRMASTSKVVAVCARCSLFQVVVQLGADLGEYAMADHVLRPPAGGADLRRPAAIGGWRTAIGGRRSADGGRRSAHQWGSDSTWQPVISKDMQAMMQRA